MSLEEQLRSLTMGANSLADGCDTQTKDIKKLRRKSRDLCEELSELHSEIADAAEAASVWRALGGFKRNRRNSKDLSEDTLLAAFKQIDSDGSGKIDRDELRSAITKENGSLKDEQVRNGLPVDAAAPSAPSQMADHVACPRPGRSTRSSTSPMQMATARSTLRSTRPSCRTRAACPRAALRPSQRRATSREPRYTPTRHDRLVRVAINHAVPCVCIVL